MLILGEILRPLEKKTDLYCNFSRCLPCSRVSLKYRHPKLGKYVVRNTEQAKFQSAQLAFRPRMDPLVYNDGCCCGDCVGQGVLSSLGENRALPFWLSITAECYLEYCFFWITRTFLGIGRNYYPNYSNCFDDSLVQGR